jgi:nucleotide-binding universal stress UspA family protein
MPITRPLIAIDLSDAAEVAARWVALVAPAGTTVVLAHAVDVPEPPSFLRPLFAGSDAVSALAETGAQQELAALAERVPFPRAECAVRAGRATEVLLRVAEEYAVDTIVLGPHGPRDGLGHFVGSTAVKIARQATVPVLVIRGDAAAVKPSRIVVAIDDSFASVAALEWAALLAADLGATMHVCTVVHPMFSSALGIAASDAERAVAIQQITDATAQWLDEVTMALPEPRPPLTSSVHLGRPAELINRVALDQHAGLLVVGRNATQASRSGLGSVADHILRDGDVSTAVIPG